MALGWPNFDAEQNSTEFGRLSGRGNQHDSALFPPRWAEISREISCTRCSRSQQPSTDPTHGGLPEQKPSGRDSRRIKDLPENLTGSRPLTFPYYATTENAMTQHRLDKHFHVIRYGVIPA